MQLTGQQFDSLGGKTIAANEEIGFVSLIQQSVVPPAGTVMASVDQTVVSADTQPVFVNSAKASVTASMPQAAWLSGAAEVRAAPGDSSSLVIDFHGQRTVSELIAPDNVTITHLYAWVGTSFATTDVNGFNVSGRNATFTELQTERLLVKVDGSSVDVNDFAQNGSAVLPTQPSDLELLVNGTRAWFVPGPITPPQFAADDIDVTAAVVAAAAAGQDVVLTFRASAPAALTLSTTVDALQRYPVVFPEGSTRTIDAPSEGVYPLALPVDGKHGPPRGGSWLVRGVVLDVSAKLPPSRVQPADGPELTDAVELTLDPDHALIVQLPSAITASLATLTGVRLPVVVSSDGGELAGTLRTNVPPTAAGGENSPGDPIPKAALGPVTLTAPAPAAADAVTWIDLTLTAPHPLASGEIVWLEIQAARGPVTWKMATRPSNDGSVAQLRRRTSSGTYVHLSPLADEYAGAVRIVGQARPNEPLAAVAVAVAGAESRGAVAGVPTQAGATLALALDPTNPVAFPATPDGDATQFPLALTISTPGSYAVTAAELRYTTSGGST